LTANPDPFSCAHTFWRNSLFFIFFLIQKMKLFTTVFLILAAGSLAMPAADDLVNDRANNGQTVRSQALSAPRETTLTFGTKGS
jgi:hypothetical protein